MVNIVLRYNSFLNFIINNKDIFFISKLWLSLCYFFFSIKQKVFTAIYLKTNNQSLKKNSIIKVYF